MKNNEKDLQNDEKKEEEYKIPMEVTNETIKDFDIDPAKVVWWNFGGYRARAFLVPATEEQYYEYMRPFWKEEKWKLRRQSKQISLEDLCETTMYRQSDQLSVEAEVMKKILLEELSKCREELEEIDQIIIELFDNEVSEVKIGKQIGMCQKTVNNKKRRIFRRLNKKLS